MATTLNLMAQPYWMVESSTYKFPPIELRDESGVLVSNPATVQLTWYDATPPDYAIVNNLVGEDIKTGRGKVSGGILTLTLTPEDLVLLPLRSAIQPRVALIEYTYGSGGTKARALEVHCVVKGIRYRPTGP